jgi:hypothetical protein
LGRSFGSILRSDVLVFIEDDPEKWQADSTPAQNMASAAVEMEWVALRDIGDPSADR